MSMSMTSRRPSDESPPLAPSSQRQCADDGHMPGDLSVDELHARVREILDRHHAVGFALAIIRKGRVAFFYEDGLTEIASRTPITKDTVFRIGSITKLFTSIAVMQLWERGLVDLDAPANDYLRAYRVIPVESAFRPVSIRHLLTHTSGIPEVRHLADLFQAGLTPSGGRPAALSVPVGERMPSLAEYYRGGLRSVVEPGGSFAYSNHGFATLGQIVEDVTEQPLERYFRESIFEPLGMADTDLIRSERLAARLATGYIVGRHGATPAPDRDWIGAGAGAIYSTSRDIASFAAALLGGGTRDGHRFIQTSTLATMFAAHYQPDPRIPGIGLGFFRSKIGHHAIVGHDGILPGFNTELLLAPDDGIGLVAFTNGSSGAFGWLQIEMRQLLGDLFGAAAEPRPDVPPHPEIWHELCGRYVFQPRISDLRIRLMLGGGAVVFVANDRLMARIRTTVPFLYRDFPLQPVDERDPEMHWLDLAKLGMPPVRAVFSRPHGGRSTAVHTDFGGQPWSLIRRDHAPAIRWLAPMVAGLAVAGVVAAVRIHRMHSRSAA